MRDATSSSGSVAEFACSVRRSELPVRARREPVMKKPIHTHLTLKELIQLGMDEDGVHRSTTRNRREEGNIAECGRERSDGLSLDRIADKYLVWSVGRKGFGSRLGLRSSEGSETTLYSPLGG